MTAFWTISLLLPSCQKPITVSLVCRVEPTSHIVFEWQNRISILETFYFDRHGERDCYTLSLVLLTCQKPDPRNQLDIQPHPTSESKMVVTSTRPCRSLPPTFPGDDAILIVVSHLSKAVHFIRMAMNINSIQYYHFNSRAIKLMQIDSLPFLRVNRPFSRWRFLLLWEIQCRFTNTTQLLQKHRSQQSSSIGRSALDAASWSLFSVLVLQGFRVQVLACWRGEKSVPKKK